MRRLRGLAPFVLCGGAMASAAEVRSPDGRVALSFRLADSGGRQGCPVYSVSYRGRPVIAESAIGFDLAGGGSLADGFEVVDTAASGRDETWKPVCGERSSVRDHHNELVVTLRRKDAPGHALELALRCYDSGAAFRWTIRGERPGSVIGIAREHARFRFLGDHVTWVATSAQGTYRRTAISGMGGGVERPLTVRVDDRVYVALAEARLVDYARMKFAVSKDDPLCVLGELEGEVRSALPLVTPWRVVMVAESPGRLLESNDIILNLNDPCAIADTSWIRPGKVIREVTLTTAGGRACVDLAARRGLQFVEFDAGWYGHEYDDASDATTVTVDPKRSPGPLDLHDVIAYARGRGIGIILYVNRRALERQLDEILPLYKSWGVAGVKYGFVNVGPERWTAWLHEAVRKAAEHGLMVDVHDEYRPTGYSRTYPNLMTQEGIRGDEAKPSNELTLTILFTRMLAGAADNTICYYDPRVDENASHAYQLAKAVCLYSPWQFLYWYDRPPGSPGAVAGRRGVIGDEPELEFFDRVPTVWDDTKVVHGSVGEYAALARRSGEEWFVGCMNGAEPRTLEVPLGFLAPGRRYVAHVYSDDPAAATRTRVRVERFMVDSRTVLKAPLAARGGQAMRLAPAARGDRFPRYR